MPNIIEITDIAAPELDVFARLTETQLRLTRDAEQGIFIAESPKVITRALDAGFTPVSLLMERKHLAGQGAELIARCGEIPVYTGESELLTQLTGYQMHRGILCAMRRKPMPAVEEVCAGARRVAVLVTPTCCDPLNRRAVRVSMGTVFQVPWTRIGETPADWLENGPALLRKLGFKTAAMALEKDSVSVDDAALCAEERLAIVLGTEGDGLAPATIAACDYTVCIPMAHEVDSLNVAAAGAVAFWQLRAN